MALGIWLQTGMYVLDLLNEVLNIDFGQGAAKILKSAGSAKRWRVGFEQGRVCNFDL